LTKRKKGRVASSGKGNEELLSLESAKLLATLAKGLKKVQRRRGVDLKVYTGLDMTGS
jgi:hypothetical protein